MQSKPDSPSAQQTFVKVSLVFLVLAGSLQALVWLYWGRILEPRLRREAASQASVLAHSQAVKLADSLLIADNDLRLHVLNEQVSEIMLFTGSESSEPLFSGLDLEVDYDVVGAGPGSLDLNRGEQTCPSCFKTEIALYSPVSDELIGIARFRVSDIFFQRLNRDVKKTLFAQACFATFLLFLVWGLVMFQIRDVNRSRRQAEAANMAKSAFLANMSHELRTPLNAIIGFSDLMGHEPGIPPKQKENLAIINRSGEFLLELINDVLELSKIEAVHHTLTETSFDLYETLEKVTEMVRFRAEKKELRLVLERGQEVPRYIKTDERKLRQILLNLLGNAVKFTDEGGVTLRVKRDQDQGSGPDNALFRLHFEVEDSGPGIAPEERQDLFEVFSQSRVGYEKREGTGLGLAISRQFVHNLGGEIRVESTIGKGALFMFSVLVKPAFPGEMEPDRPPRKVVGLLPSAGTQPDRYRILVVDDHPENRALLCLLLEQVGFEVESAENGRQAVELSASWQPHLIWMDMRMPVMNGYEATKQILRACEGGEHPVIIALTASAFQEDRETVLAAGCDDFVRRPFRESEIFDAMHRHLGVNYIYEDIEAQRSLGPAEEGCSAADLPQELAQLPPQVIAELKTAIELSDIELMEQLALDIGMRHGPLADTLQRLIASFQYDRILTAIEAIERPSVANSGVPK